VATSDRLNFFPQPADADFLRREDFKTRRSRLCQPRFRIGLLTLILAIAGSLPNLLSQNYSVSIYFDAGFGEVPFVANENGVAQNGYTVSVGSFLSSNVTDVEALGYNRLWIANQFTATTNNGSVTTFTDYSQPGSFSAAQPFRTTNANFKGKPLWVVFSDNSTISGSSRYGAMTSSAAAWTMPTTNSLTHLAELYSDDITAAAFGVFTGGSGTDSLNARAVPGPYLYWDSNNSAGLGGSGTWSASLAETRWTTESGGAGGDGSYAWGTTSGSNYYAGAGLTAHFAGMAGTVTINGTVEARSGLRFETDYTLTSGTLLLAGSNASANAITVTNGTTTVSSTISGSNGLVKSGEGSLLLSGNTTVSGSLAINGGTLQAGAADALGSVGSITVNSAGSLLVNASGAINDSADINLAGGRLALAGSGVADTVGQLTLTLNSVLDVGAFVGARSLYFTNSSDITWTEGATLSIWNWNGTSLYGVSHGDGDRQIFFGSDSTGLASSQLQQISFYSDSGTTLLGGAYIRSSGEIGVVPEPEAVACAAALLAGVGLHLLLQRRRRSR
jgi:autotransporter-associated beta strand protein